MTENKYHKDFRKELEAAARSRFLPDVFSDAVAMMADSIWSPFAIGEREEVEKDYRLRCESYEKEDLPHFGNMFGITMMALEARREDFLGHMLELIGATNSRNGQFFTPPSVSRLMASVSTADITKDYTPGKIVTIGDPACGAGVIMIEAAECLVNECGVRQGDILIDMGDVDGRACDIAYIQASLLGYPAVVRHQDALSRERFKPDRYTPGYFLHCLPMRRRARMEAKLDGNATPHVCEQKLHVCEQKTAVCEPQDGKLEQACFNF